MLGKLLKYELKRSARRFCPLVIGYMIISVMLAVFSRMNFGNSDVQLAAIFAIIAAAYGILTMVLFVLGFSLSLSNFNKTLFTDEGYLMLTIPVKPCYHIFVKLISSVVWSAASIAVFLISLLIIDMDGFANDFKEFAEAVSVAFTHEPLTALLACLLMLACFADLQIFFYFVISLSNCFRHKALAGFAIVFANSIITSVISGLTSKSSVFGFLYIDTAVDINVDAHLCIMILYQLFYITVYFLLTNFIITRKHNLQ